MADNSRHHFQNQCAERRGNNQSWFIIREMSIELFLRFQRIRDRQGWRINFWRLIKMSRHAKEFFSSAKVADRLTHEHFRRRRDAASVVVSPMHLPVGIIHDEPHEFFFVCGGKSCWEGRESVTKRKGKNHDEEGSVN